MASCLFWSEKSHENAFATFWYTLLLSKEMNYISESALKFADRLSRACWCIALILVGGEGR